MNNITNSSEQRSQLNLYSYLYEKPASSKQNQPVDQREPSVDPEPVAPQRALPQDPDRRAGEWAAQVQEVQCHTPIARRVQYPGTTRQRKNQQDQLNSAKQILKRIGDKRRTFATFAFTSVELEDEKMLKPFIADLKGKQKAKGSMNVNELWAKDSLRQYNTLNDFCQIKRMVKRLATLQKKQSSSKQPKQATLFTNKTEKDLKYIINSQNGSDRIRESIKKKFTDKNRRSIVSFAENQMLYLSAKQKKLPELQLQSTTKHHSELHDINTQKKKDIDMLVSAIDETLQYTVQDKKELKGLISKIQEKIIRSKQHGD